MISTVCGEVKQWQRGEWGLVFLLLVSLALKFSLLFPGHVINPDGVRYIDAARQFAEGSFQEGLSAEKMPFYPLLIAAFHYLSPDWILAGQLISLFSMVFALVPLYWLSKGIFDEKVAFWTGLAFVLSPILNGISIDLIRDPIFLCFFTWSVYFFWRSLTNPRSCFFVLASLCAILALFCRIEGAFLFPVYFLVLLVLAVRNSPERRPLFKGIAVLGGLPLFLGIVSGSVLMGVAGIEFSSFGRFGEIREYLHSMVNGDFLAMYHSLYAQLKSFKNPAAHWSTGSIAETTRHYLPFIYLIGLAEAMFRNLFLLYVVPLWAGLGKRPAFNRGHWLILLVGGSYFLVAYYFLFTHDFISKRYILVPALMLYPWAGRGLERIWSWIPGTRRPKVAMVFFLVIFCGVPVYKTLSEVVGPDKGNIFRVAGNWLASQTDLQNATLACSDPRIRLYSPHELHFLGGGESFSIFSDLGQVEKVSLEKNVDLLVLETSKKRRHLVPKFKDYSLVKEFVDKKKAVLIFRRIIQSIPQNGEVGTS